MKLYIESDLSINRYYIQTLCMIFFPGAKFSESEEITNETSVVTVRASEADNGVYAFASIKVDGELKESECFERYKDVNQKQKTIKIALGIAVFTAGRDMFGCTPPWGILTGVRPSKIAEELIKEGKTASEIKEILKSEYFVNPKKAALVTDIAANEARLINNLKNNTCSVYIAIPFCPTRCAYCSFVSYSTKRLLALIPEYLERLCVDLESLFRLIDELGQTVVTIYIGGGTPTILTAEQLDVLLDKIDSLTDTSKLLEYTLEAGRPDTITAEKMAVAVAHGVSRVSINPQTINDEILEAIGRKHTAEQFYIAYNLARNSGVKYINTDLIAGLPGEGYASFSKSVDAILKLRPDNITFHTFCVKKAADILKSSTEVYSRTGGETGKSVDYSQIKSKNAGYIPYYMYRQKNTVGNFENVGFSLKGAEGLYNIFIMEEVHSIFAAGAGAVTKLVSPDRQYIERVFMPKYPYEYLDMSDNPEAMSKAYEQIRTFYRSR